MPAEKIIEKEENDRHANAEKNVCSRKKSGSRLTMRNS